MRTLKIFSVLLLTLGLLMLMGGSSPLMADENDPPHETHLTADRGHGITDCGDCHTGTPAYDNVDIGTCGGCHSPGGVWNGVSDADVGALNSWHNWGDPGDATQSLVYQEDGKLKSGKDKWCASCHDEDGAVSSVVIADFESYTTSTDLRGPWSRVQDAKQPYLEPFQSGKTGPNGNFMRVKLDWAKTTYDHGTAVREFPAVDTASMLSLDFNVTVWRTAKITSISVQLRKQGTTSWSVATFDTSELQDEVWELVSIPKESFSPALSGSVDKIRLRGYEYNPTTTWKQNMYFDDLTIKVAGAPSGGGGPNVVGDNEDYGHYKTGHGMACTQCHDSTSAHIDGESLPVLEYIKSTPNPTNFRFHDDPTKQLRLPYNYNNTDVYNSDDFALCYWCHSETNLIGDPWGDGTNFKDGPPPECGLSPNLHYLHVYNFADDQWPQSCVHCHDPHGQFNPVMTRKEMGDAIVFDTNGCEILPGADSDSDGIDDRHDPDVNMGLAMQSDLLALADGPTCDSCHYPYYVTPPNQPPCNPGDDPYEQEGCLNDGFYVRTYEPVGHSGGGVDESCGIPGCHDVTQGSHATHTQGTAKGPDPLECADCHIDGSPYIEDMLAAGACNTCHSPGGAFDGVNNATIGAKNNWDDGIYESDGRTLKSGKDQWCASCHDDQPANSKADGTGVNAPNVVGDNTTYGFYKTGHDINCLSCHNSGKEHIDGLHRTYEVDEGVGVVNPYGDSYRLRSVDCAEPMNIPRPKTSDSPRARASDFALCFDCHNLYEIVGTAWDDVTHTNFWNNDDEIENSHNKHLKMYRSDFDSDWDGTGDSEYTCVACHNVHGAPNQAMIRHGELIKVNRDFPPDFEALNFSYLKPGTDFATATWNFSGSADSYNVYVRWHVAPSVPEHRATNAKYTLNYDGSSVSFMVNQRGDGSTWNQFGTGTYSFGSGNSVMLSNEGADGPVVADAIGWDRDGVFVDDWDMDGVLDPEIVVDNAAASYLPSASEWPSSSWYAGYHGSNYQYHTIPDPVQDPSASLVESIGGIMDYAGFSLSANGVCSAGCHTGDSIPYYRLRPDPAPQVIFPRSKPSSVDNDGTTQVLLLAHILDKDNNLIPLNPVVVDVLPIGGGTDQQPLYDDGTNGDEQPNDGIFTFQTTVPGTVDVGDKTLVVTATDQDGQSSEKSFTLKVTNPDIVIVDNKDCALTDFTDNDGPWTTSSYAANYYPPDYQYHAGGAGSDYFQWTPTITIPGQYTVSVWYPEWQTGWSWATDAAFTVYHDGGSTPFTVNQQTQGGTWVTLDTFSFDGTDDYVRLSQHAWAQVIADAIKLERQP